MVSQKTIGLLAVIVIAASVLTIGTQQYWMPPEKPKEVEIKIGLLVDLSGPLTSFGEDIRDATTIGIDDINAYFAAKGMPYKAKLFVEDTKVDPKIALDKVQALHGKGITLIVGPMGSGEVKQISEYVNANKIIIVSPSSTAAPSLLGVTKVEEKKFIIRFVATDTFQTRAIAKMASGLGIKGVVVAYIGNAWGKGLNDFGKPEFAKQNIEVKESIEYADPPPADFTPYIARLESVVNDLQLKYAKSEIAVVGFSYEEIYTVLTQIKTGSPLLEVKWLGCDGTAKSRRISEIPEKVNKVKVYSTLFESKGASFAKLNETYRKRFGRDTYQYALNAYDAEWVLALSFADVYGRLGKYDADEMAKVLPTVTEKYSKGDYGVTPVSGYISLDKYNDRASGDYAVWAVENGNWVLKGTWKSQADSIEWK